MSEDAGSKMATTTTPPPSPKHEALLEKDGSSKMNEHSPVQFMDDPLLENLVTFCMRDAFQEKFFWFCQEHCLKFSLDEEEHRIEYSEYHRQYMDEFESQITLFLEQEEMSDKQFFLRCRTAQARDVKAAHYLNIFLASIEYESFHALMLNMKRRRLEAEEASGSPPTSPTSSKVLTKK